MHLDLIFLIYNLMDCGQTSKICHMFREGIRKLNVEIGYADKSFFFRDLFSIQLHKQEGEKKECWKKPLPKYIS